MRLTAIYLNRIKQSSFASKLIGLVSGTIVSQAIPILLSPVFSRLYVPFEFGDFAIYLSVSAILSVVSTGRYSMAIMVEDDIRSRRYLFWGSIFISVVFCLLCFLVGYYLLPIFINNDFIKSPVNNLAISLGTFFLGVNQLLGFWFNKNNQLNIVSKSKVAQGIGIGLASIVLGVWKVSLLNGLIWGYTAGMLFSNLYFWTALVKDFRKTDPFNFWEMFKVLKKHKEYPLFNAPGALMNSLALQTSTIAVSYIFDKVIVGYWGFTVRLIQVPSSLISFSLSQILFQRFTSLKENGKLQNKHEEVFDVDVKYFDNTVTFTQTVNLKSAVKTNITGNIEYMVCNDKECLPPKKVAFDLQLQ